MDAEGPNCKKMTDVPDLATNSKSFFWNFVAQQEMSDFGLSIL